MLRMIVLDGVEQRTPLDKAHCINELTIGVASESIDRNNARMLQAGCNFGLTNEAQPGRAGAIQPAQDALKGDRPLEFSIFAIPDFAEAAGGVRPDCSIPRRHFNIGRDISAYRFVLNRRGPTV